MPKISKKDYFGLPNPFLRFIFYSLLEKLEGLTLPNTNFIAWYAQCTFLWVVESNLEVILSPFTPFRAHQLHQALILTNKNICSWCVQNRVSWAAQFSSELILVETLSFKFHRCAGGLVLTNANFNVWYYIKNRNLQDFIIHFQVHLRSSHFPFCINWVPSHAKYNAESLENSALHYQAAVIENELNYPEDLYFQHN